MTTSAQPNRHDVSPCLMTLPRYFDVRSVPQTSEQFESLLERHEVQVVLDFSNVEFIDSSAIGAVIYLFKRLHGQQRQLQLLKLSGQPRRTLIMLSVDKAIPFVDEVA